MTTPRLSSIQINGFRSINQPVSLQLDAPMVLIHGNNGAGKTSLLSALELALTGSVPSLARADKGYRRELANYDTGVGSISLRVDGLGEDFRDLDIELSRSTRRTPSGLSERAAHFYSERCYLAQTTLSQLLAIYSGDDTSIDTPLSQFAAELLGLDRLDALQRGLHPARDARNVRPLVPTYRTLEDRRDVLAQSVTSIEAEIESLKAALVGLSRRSSDPEIAATAPGSPDEDGEESLRQSLVSLDDQARMTAELARSLERIMAARTGTGRETSALLTNAAEAEVMEWRGKFASRIEQLLAASAAHLPEVPTGITVEIGHDIARLADELGRLSRASEAAILNAAANEARLKEIDYDLATSQSSVADLDRNIEVLGRAAPDLAAMLSTVLPHIHGDDCPVCGRDFSEDSEKPLADVVRERVSALTSAHSRLAEVTNQRSTLTGRIAELNRERELLLARSATAEERLQDQAAAAKLQSLLAEAKQLEEPAATGGATLLHHTEVARASELLARSDVEERILVDDLLTLERQLGVQNATAGRLDDRISTLSTDIEARRKALIEKLEQARTADVARQELAAASLKLNDAERRLGEQMVAKKRADDAFRAARAVRKSVVRIADAAANARSRVVADVFNDRLNSLWRDLFVRLAPDEEFIPSFDVPIGQSGQVRPVLKTLHRSGEVGGSPGVMLSSGNLNTAALTLFLALHLSVQPKLPWLILDDPVQSMDDVHIAHFAALLRTLSKEKGRQILVAVHDRALFDYLAFEMSPAFPEDELITVELSRSSAGETRYKTMRHGYVERPRIVASAA